MSRRFTPGDFDAAFYRRFYRDPATRVSDLAEVVRLARFVHAYLGYLRLPIASVLDIGCGLGHWRAAMRKLKLGAQYRGTEVSPLMCRRYGWAQVSIADWRAKPRADLVVCRSVLQYLTRAEAERAIVNLAASCRFALYFEVLTRRDWTRLVDRARTDGSVHLRSAAWYRKRLGKHFRDLGGGLFLRRSAPVSFYEMETRDRI
jgi:SAM-dependent methyltransferase